MARITKRVVDQIERGRSYYIWDDVLPGFGIRVRVTGSAAYVVDYRVGEGGRRAIKRRYTLGSVGSMTPDAARKEAQAIIGDVRRGNDPQGDRATRRKSMTVRDLCDTYLDAAERGLIVVKGGKQKKASTIYSDRGRIERHIKPLLGGKLVKDLKQSDINKFIRDVTAGKTAAVVKTGKVRGKAIVEGGAGTAARTAGLLGGILSFAVSEGVIEVNPARGVKRPSDNTRKRRLSDAEYRALGGALEAGVAAGDAPQGLAGVWLLALTGCRLGEIEKLRRAEAVKEEGCFYLADTKTGASIRPVGRSAFDVIGKIADEGNPFVLTSVRGEGRFGALPTAVERIMARAGLPGVTAHTLRHSFASKAADLGYSELVIAALLGHSSGTITSKYIHQVDQLLVAAANRVSSSIYEAMTGKAETPAENNVVDLDERRVIA